MATGSYPLPVFAARLPDGTASNKPPQIMPSKSSATSPAPYWQKALFDANTGAVASDDEWLVWVLKLPANYASGPVLKIPFSMASAVTGNVIMRCKVAAITPGDATDIDAKAFDAGNNDSSATAVPATTAGKVGEISITLTNVDSWAAGDLVALMVQRVGSSASDTASGDLEIDGLVVLEYTTT